MDIQIIITIGFISIAVAFAGKALWNKRRSFSTKAGCGDDCGCNGNSKKLTS